MDITHWDIKPANILIQQKRPDLIIKLSDFGLSNKTARLVMFCETEIYCAPEIEESYRRKIKPQGTNTSYTNAVDM
jgi:serine/threonine protein kinase